MLSIPVFGQGNHAEHLWNSYKQKSTEELDRFFKNWAREIQPITNAELVKLNDTLQQAYKVFESFYQPKDIEKIGGSEWGNEIYANAKYLVVQSSIRIGFTKTLNKDSVIHSNVKKIYPTDTTMQNKFLRKVNGKYEPQTLRMFYSRDAGVIIDTIKEFRPQIERAVFLTEEYESLMNAFLGGKHYELGYRGIMNPAKAKGESKRRLDFINQMVTIFHGHWGGYWILESHPYAYDIIFDSEMKFALVNYKLIYEGGEVLLERQIHDNWKILEARRTWIE